MYNIRANNPYSSHSERKTVTDYSSIVQKLIAIFVICKRQSMGITMTQLSCKFQRNSMTNKWTRQVGRIYCTIHDLSLSFGNLCCFFKFVWFRLCSKVQIQALQKQNTSFVLNYATILHQSFNFDHEYFS